MLAPTPANPDPYCFSLPFTPATVVSLLFVEHTRHAPQIAHNFHWSPSLLSTLPLLAKSFTSFTFSPKHHLVMKPSLTTQSTMVTPLPTAALPVYPSPTHSILFKTYHIQTYSLLYLFVMFLDYCLSLLLECEPHKERVLFCSSH